MIKYNPLYKNDGSLNGALSTAPSESIVFDIPGKCIWVKGVKLKGTDTTYSFSHDNYITLTNTPGDPEDIKIGVNITTLKSVIDTTYGIVSDSANGLAPKYSIGNIAEGSTSEDSFLLGWQGNVLKWYKLPYREVKINDTEVLSAFTKTPLAFMAGAGISVDWDSVNGRIVITNTKPDINHNTDYQVGQYITSSDFDYRILLKRNANDTEETGTARFAATLTYNPSARILKINNTKVITASDIYQGATISSAGVAGLVPAATSAQARYFLRGDGTWSPPSGFTDTWRPIKINNTERLDFGIDSGALNLIQDGTISLIWDNANKAITISNAAWRGATSSTDGTAGYMPAPTSSLRLQFLRGDGTWVSLNDYSLPLAANGTRGGVLIGFVESERNYAVRLSSEKMFVTVPWENTTYLNGVGLLLNNNIFSLAPTGVTAGTYKRVIVDEFGRVTAGDNIDDNTWRAIKVEGSQKLSNSTDTGALDFHGGEGIEVTFDSTNKRINIKNTSPDVNHNVTTSAVIARSSSSVAHISSTQTNPYYNLIEGGLVSRSIQFVAGTGIAISASSDGQITITNTEPDINHNTDRTGIKLGTIGGTKRTDNTVILTNSITGLTILGGTNKFSIGDGTNYIEVPVNHGLYTKNITINGNTYALYTSSNSLPTFVAPGGCGSADQILATNSSGTGLIWVTKPTTNVTTSAVVGSSATATSLITTTLSNPYYNLLEGGLVARSIRFVAGNGIIISATTDGQITITNSKPDVNHDTHYTTTMYIGESNDTKSNVSVTNPYLKLFDDNTRRSTLRFVAGNGIAIGSDTNGNITITNSKPDINHDTHYTTTMYIGDNNDTKANTQLGNPYLKIFDDNTRRSTLRFVAGNGITVASDTSGNITITNSAPDVNHNTDRTGVKLGTVSGSKITSSTVIINNSSTGLTFLGGTNLFKIGDGTNYIEVPVSPSFTVTNKSANILTSLTTLATIAGTDITAKVSVSNSDATIGTSSTTIATVAGINITAKIASYASSGHTHPLSIATDSGTNQLTLVEATKYKLTAGGQTFIFTTPSNALTVRVNNKSTHPSSGSETYYIPMASTYDGNATLYGSTDFFMYRTNSANYLNIGRSGITSGITFHNANESNGGYGDLVTAACTAYRSWTLPNASGIIALTSQIPTVNNASLTLQVAGTTLTIFYADDATNKTFNVTCANIGAATSGHTHPLSIATTSDASSISLTASTKYKLTAGGSTYVFTSTPDERVRQVPKTDNVNRPLMMINGGTTQGEQVNTSMFSTGIYANASTKTIYASIFNGTVNRAGVGASWVNGRTSALLRETSVSGYHALWSLKTTSGSWEFGEYNSANWYDLPVLTYITDANFNSSTNTATYQIKFPLASGTVALTSLIPTVNNASLTLLTGGTTLTTFYANDSTNRTFNVTCANIGAATSSHEHKRIKNYYDSRPSSANVLFGDGYLYHFKATSTMTTGKPAWDGHILHFAWDNNSGWDSLIAISDSGAGMLFRGQSSGTWNAWKTVLDSANYTSYVKNASLTLQTAGTTQTTFYANDSTNRTFNVTCANIGAATSSHNHDGRYVIDAGGNITSKIYNIATKSVFSGNNLADAPVTGWVSGLVLGSNWNNNHYQHYLVEGGGRWYATRSYSNGSMNSWNTFAYLSDIPTKSSWNYDDRYVKKAGDTMTGTLYHDGETSSVYKTTRKISGGSGWAFAPFYVRGNDNASFFNIGVYGSANSFTYCYIGPDTYSSANNLRIAPTYIGTTHLYPNAASTYNIGSSTYPYANLYLGKSNGAGIYYVGSKSTYRMIRFIDNTSDTYGNGISIGGGGLTVLGSGESADTLLSNLSLTSSGGSETTYIASDGAINFYPSINSWDAAGLISMTAGRLWVGVSGNTTRENQIGLQSGAGQMLMYAHAATNGSRGIWVTAHGTGSARIVFNVDTNNKVTFADAYTGSSTALAYSQAAMTASTVTWLTCWNGYELRAISKQELYNCISSYISLSSGYIATTAVLSSSTPALAITGTGNITPNSNASYNLGSTSYYWNVGYIRSLFSDTTLTLKSGSSAAMLFLTNGANTRMCIDSPGNIGMGTTAPVRKLHVIGEAVIGETNYRSPLGTNSNYNGTWIGQGWLELSSTNPYIDFHYNKSTSDYTTRLVQWDSNNRFTMESNTTALSGYLATCEGNQYNIVCLGVITIYRTSATTTSWLVYWPYGLVTAEVVAQPVDRDTSPIRGLGYGLILRIKPYHTSANSYTRKYTTANVIFATATTQSHWVDGNATLGRTAGSDRNTVYDSYHISINNSTSYGSSYSSYGRGPDYGNILAIVARRPNGHNDNGYIGEIQNDGLLETGNGSIASFRLAIFGYLS